jgi:hypothetical protein
LWEFIKQEKISRSSIIKAAGLVLISASGLLAYSAYLGVYYKDPLYFINAQNLWHGRDKLVLPFSTLIARLADLPGLFGLKVDEMKTNLNALYFTAAIALNIYGFRKIKGPEFIYLTIVVVFLSLQALLMSLSRYISGIFVVWIIAAIFISNRRNPQVWLFCATACFLIWQAVINFRWMAGIWVG